MQGSDPITCDQRDGPDHRVEAQCGPTIYFDGSCPLCSAEIRHYASRHGGEDLTFVDVSDRSNNLGPDLSHDAARQRFHVRLPDGSLVSGARGFVMIWERLPGWQWLARLARLPGVPWLLEGMYRLFLPVRPVLSRVALWMGATPMAPPDDRS